MKEKDIIENKIIGLKNELEGMKHFKVLFEGMLGTKHEEEGQNFDSVIDYFYQKSKEYE